MGKEGGKHGKSSTEEIIDYFCASAVVFQLIALALRIDFPNEKGKPEEIRWNLLTYDTWYTYFPQNYISKHIYEIERVLRICK